MRYSFLSPTLSRILMAPADENGSEGGGGAGGTETPEQKAAREAADAAKKKDGEIDPLKADINKLIENARKQEKEKLYGEITTLKETAKTHKELAEARAAELASLKAKFDEVSKKIKPADDKGGEGDKGGDDKKPAGLGEADVDRIVNATVAATAKQFETALAEANAKIQELSTAREQETLSQYRERLISENKDYIVPELVTGTTREALDTSLVTAKQVFARLSKSLKPANGGGDGGDGAALPETTSTLTLPPTPNVNNNGAPGAPTKVDVKRLSNKDYAANREALLKAAAAEARKALTAG